MTAPAYLAGFGVGGFALARQRRRLATVVVALAAFPILLAATLWCVWKLTGYTGGETGGWVDLTVNYAMTFGLIASPLAAISALIFMFATSRRRESSRSAG